MSTDLEVFRFPDTNQQIRTVVIDGEPWFVAAEIALALGYRDAYNATRWLHEIEKGTHQMSTPGGLQNVTIVSEAGLYRLVMRSNQDNAIRFQMWIAHEVLPTLLKTGSYSIEPAAPQHVMPQSFSEALELAARQARALEEKDAALAIAEPKADAWDVLASAQGDYSVREAAFILDRDPNISTGQNRLFATLREFQMVDRRGTPYQTHAAHLNLRLGSYENAKTHETVATSQVRITAAGVKYLHRRMGGVRQPAFTELLREISA